MMIVHICLLNEANDSIHNIDCRNTPFGYETAETSFIISIVAVFVVSVSVIRYVSLDNLIICQCYAMYCLSSLTLLSVRFFLYHIRTSHSFSAFITFVCIAAVKEIYHDCGYQQQQQHQYNNSKG